LVQGVVEPLGVALGVVVLELHVLPVGLEGGAELVEECRRLGLAQADVPFEAFQEGGSRGGSEWSDLP